MRIAHIWINIVDIIYGHRLQHLAIVILISSVNNMQFFWFDFWNSKPIHPVLDVSLLEIYLFIIFLFFGQLFRFFCTSGKYKFFRRLAKRAQTASYFLANQNWHPVSIALVSSNMNTTGTKTSPVSRYYLVGWFIQCETSWLCAVRPLLLYSDASLVGISNV